MVIGERCEILISSAAHPVLTVRPSQTQGLWVNSNAGKFTGSITEIPSKEIPGKLQGNLQLVSNLEILEPGFPVGKLMGNLPETSIDFL